MIQAKDKKTIAELYAHISNSGYTFKVVDNDFGSELSIEYGSLGITSQKISILMDVDTMREIGEMLIEASKAEFSDNGYLGTASLAKYDGHERGDGSVGGDSEEETEALCRAAME